LPAEPGPDRVERDIPEQLEEVPFRVDESGVVSTLEDVAELLVTVVERLRVQPVQTVHPLREIPVSRRD
jgi:hypothetical protein